MPSPSFSAEAEADLAVFERGLRTRSPEGALAYADGLRQRCDLFAARPRIGTAVGADAALRVHTFDRRIAVLYECLPDEVRILRVLPLGVDWRSFARGPDT